MRACACDSVSPMAHKHVMVRRMVAYSRPTVSQCCLRTPNLWAMVSRSPLTLHASPYCATSLSVACSPPHHDMLVCHWGDRIAGAGTHSCRAIGSPSCSWGADRQPGYDPRAPGRIGGGRRPGSHTLVPRCDRTGSAALVCERVHGIRQGF